MSSAIEPTSVSTPLPTGSITAESEMSSRGDRAPRGALRSLIATRRNVAHWLFPPRLSE